MRFAKGLVGLVHRTDGPSTVFLLRRSRTAGLAILATAALVALTGFPSTASASSFTWTNCGPADAPLSFSSVHASPDPLVAGQSYAVVETGAAGTDFPSGTVYELTTVLPSGATSTLHGTFGPLFAGAFGTTVTGLAQTASEGLASGAYEFQLTVPGPTRVLGCLDVHLQVARGRGSAPASQPTFLGPPWVGLGLSFAPWNLASQI